MISSSMGVLLFWLEHAMVDLPNITAAFINLFKYTVTALYIVV